MSIKDPWPLVFLLFYHLTKIFNFSISTHYLNFLSHKRYGGKVLTRLETSKWMQSPQFEDTYSHITYHRCTLNYTLEALSLGWWCWVECLVRDLKHNWHLQPHPEAIPELGTCLTKVSGGNLHNGMLTHDRAWWRMLGPARLQHTDSRTSVPKQSTPTHHLGYALSQFRLPSLYILSLPYPFNLTLSHPTLSS